MQDRLYVDKKDRALYDKLEKEDMFKGKSRKEQFFFAMGIGFKNDVSIPIENKDNFFLEKDMKEEDEALLRAIAVYKEGEQVLLNKDEIYKIAERYAHAGIRLLDDKINSVEFATFWKRLESELIELYNSMKFN